VKFALIFDTKEEAEHVASLAGGAQPAQQTQQAPAPAPGPMPGFTPPPAMPGTGAPGGLPGFNPGGAPAPGPMPGFTPPPPAPQSPQPPQQAQGQITQQMLNDALSAAIPRKQPSGVLAILQKYGAQRVQDLNPQYYPMVYQELTAA
jgi:hypothetical protein